ncbi:trypsin-like serine protease [Bdellovibrio sp. HCB2-146]|uniref:trypsin-like serine protease n=1 Tax=Bdellovibrio sp. HCB2-146 TaxID=3394362 RepID=UPI0039BC2BAC
MPSNRRTCESLYSISFTIRRTLVAKNVFLTAAHCLDSSNKEVYVTMAANIRNVSAENTGKVSLREIHPEYDGSGGRYDLALGVFRRDFSKTKKPFPLPKDGTLQEKVSRQSLNSYHEMVDSIWNVELSIMSRSEHRVYKCR